MDKEKELTRVSLFAKLSHKYIKGLANVCIEKNFPAGSYLVKQGTDGIGLYIITSGTVIVQKKNEEDEIVETSSNGPGDVIGEMSVIDGAQRSADVIAETDTACLLLTSWEFNSFMRSHPEVALEILPVIVKRFRETNDNLLRHKAALSKKK